MQKSFVLHPFAKKKKRKRTLETSPSDGILPRNNKHTGTDKWIKGWLRLLLGLPPLDDD